VIRGPYEDIGGTEMPNYDDVVMAHLDCPKCGAALDVSAGDVGGASNKTLRDEFAMAALTGDLSNVESTTDIKTRAEWCYAMADALMEARK
jgi:hypothetical protein